MPTTINFQFAVDALVGTFVLTSITRSDNGSPPLTPSVPYSLTEGSPTAGIYPWSGTLTDNSPPDYYNVYGLIDGQETPLLRIDGVPSTPPDAIPCVLGQFPPPFKPISVYQNSDQQIQFIFTDSNGNAVSLTGQSLEMSFWTSPDGGITQVNLFTYTTGTGSITIGGSGGNLVMIQFDELDLQNLLQDGGQYTLTNDSIRQVLVSGYFAILPSLIGAAMDT